MKCIEGGMLYFIQSPAANLVRLSYPIVHQIERTMILSEAEESCQVATYVTCHSTELISMLALPSLLA